MKRNSAPASVWRNPVHFVAFGFGAGAAPVAPGTFGTLIALPIYLLIADLPLPHYLLLTLVMTLAGFWICHKTAKDLAVHDHPGIVWDEIVGYLVTMIAAPPGLVWMLAGFILFRVFDILKPWPIRWIDQKVAGGIGIMLDDLLAGLFALIGLQLGYHVTTLLQAS